MVDASPKRPADAAALAERFRRATRTLDQMLSAGAAPHAIDWEGLVWSLELVVAEAMPRRASEDDDDVARKRARTPPPRDALDDEFDKPMRGKYARRDLGDTTRPAR
jgi:hypothetical protein